MENTTKFHLAANVGKHLKTFAKYIEGDLKHSTPSEVCLNRTGHQLYINWVFGFPNPLQDVIWAAVTLAVFPGLPSHI